MPEPLIFILYPYSTVGIFDRQQHFSGSAEAEKSLAFGSVLALEERCALSAIAERETMVFGLARKLEQNDGNFQSLEDSGVWSEIQIAVASRERHDLPPKPIRRGRKKDAAPANNMFEGRSLLDGTYSADQPEDESDEENEVAGEAIEATAVTNKRRSVLRAPSSDILDEIQGRADGAEAQDKAKEPSRDEAARARRRSVLRAPSMDLDVELFMEIHEDDDDDDTEDEKSASSDGSDYTDVSSVVQFVLPGVNEEGGATQFSGPVAEEAYEDDGSIESHIECLPENEAKGSPEYEASIAFTTCFEDEGGANTVVSNGYGVNLIVPDGVDCDAEEAGETTRAHRSPSIKSSPKADKMQKEKSRERRGRISRDSGPNTEKFEKGESVDGSKRSKSLDNAGDNRSAHRSTSPQEKSEIGDSVDGDTKRRKSLDNAGDDRSAHRRSSHRRTSHHSPTHRDTAPNTEKSEQGESVDDTKRRKSLDNAGDAHRRSSHRRTSHHSPIHRDTAPNTEKSEQRESVDGLKRSDSLDNSGDNRLSHCRSSHRRTSHHSPSDRNPTHRSPLYKRTSLVPGGGTETVQIENVKAGKHCSTGESNRSEHGSPSIRKERRKQDAQDCAPVLSLSSSAPSSPEKDNKKVDNVAKKSPVKSSTNRPSQGRQATRMKFTKAQSQVCLSPQRARPTISKAESLAFIDSPRQKLENRSLSTDSSEAAETSARSDQPCEIRGNALESCPRTPPKTLRKFRYSKVNGLMAPLAETDGTMGGQSQDNISQSERQNHDEIIGSMVGSECDVFDSPDRKSKTQLSDPPGIPGVALMENENSTDIEVVGLNENSSTNRLSGGRQTTRTKFIKAQSVYLSPKRRRPTLLKADSLAVMYSPRREMETRSRDTLAKVEESSEQSTPSTTPTTTPATASRNIRHLKGKGLETLSETDGAPTEEALDNLHQSCEETSESAEVEGYLRSPARTMRRFSKAAQRLCAPKTPKKLPMLNSVDGSTRSAIACEYSIDLHRVSPVKKRTGICTSREEIEPSVNMLEGVPDLQSSNGCKAARQQAQQRRLSLSQHNSPMKRRSTVTGVNVRRLSLATPDQEDKDAASEDESFDRVMKILESLPDAQDTTSADSAVIGNEDQVPVAAPPSTRIRKATVEDLKRKLLKDRKREVERAQNRAPVEEDIGKARSRTLNPRRHVSKQATKLIPSKVAKAPGNADSSQGENS